MTAFQTRIHVAALRLGGAMRRYWRRIAIGAFCGWLVSTVVGAFVLVGLEDLELISSQQTSPLLGAALVWSGVGLGALVAYAGRPREAELPGRSGERT